MIERLYNRFKFSVERLILRGARYQLLVIAILICFVSFFAGLLAFALTSTFKAYGESAWWAFLRLSDPGYLGDDKGFILQTVSTIVTVLGYVLFMGALIAIMTQWLNQTMKKLESGVTPITQNDHFLILGWTNRTPTIARELVLSEGRVKRFLRRIGASRLHIVILAEEVTSALAYKLKEDLESRWNEKQFTFRSGTPIQIEHLRRVDFLNAGVIIIPGSDFVSEGTEVIDTRTIKSLLTISNYGPLQGHSKLPLLVAELIDARKIPIAKTAYKGEIEVIASDSVISRLIAQNVRHQGLSYIYSELLTHGDESNEIYIRECPQFGGSKFQEIIHAFPKAIPMGVIRQKDEKYIPILNPPDGFEVHSEDRFVFLARRYIETEPGESDGPVSMERKRLEAEAINTEHTQQKLLIMGWNQKIPALIREFESYENEKFEIDILSMVPKEEREAFFSRYNGFQNSVTLRHLEGDYTAPSDLKRVNPQEYDNIVMVANSWMQSNEESDARTILGYLILREMLPENALKPEILIELMDPDNEKLFAQRTGEVLISPLILSHILAHVALRRDLNVVFDELFTVGGAEIYFRSSAFYKLGDGEITFGEIGNIVFQNGDIALGVRIAEKRDDENGGIQLNPPRDSFWRLHHEDELVILTTYS